MDQRARQRSELRRRLKAERQAHGPEFRSHADGLINAALLALDELHKAQRVAAYRAIGGEVDLSAAIEGLTQSGVAVSLPRVVGEQLDFVAWTADQPTKIGPYGISEPVGGIPQPFSTHDVALVPVVGFDRLGQRLGQGGGYYDRLIAAAAPCPFLIGVAYEHQRVEALPIEPWDMPLDAVVTEAGCTRFPR